MSAPAWVLVTDFDGSVEVRGPFETEDAAREFGEAEAESDDVSFWDHYVVAKVETP